MHADTAVLKFATLIISIIVLSFLIDFFLSSSFLGKSYRIFVAPGVIIHELAHAFACLITGAKLARISFFEKEGGKVEHRPSRLPVLGPIIISTAPFIAGAVIIYFLSRRLGIESTNLAAVDITKEGIISFFKTAIANVNLKDIKTIAIIYLVLSISVTMTPSWQDLKNMFFSLVVLGIVAFVVLKLVNFNLSSFSLPPDIFVMLSTVFLLLILATIFSMIIFTLSKVIKPT